MQEPMSAPVYVDMETKEEPIVESFSTPVHEENLDNDEQLILEPLSPPVYEENMDNDEESIVEPLLPPDYVETIYNDDAQLNESIPPPSEYRNIYDSPIPISTYSSPYVSKSLNNSLEIIEIKSTESSPKISANKENIEPKFVSNDQSALIKSLKKVICSLKTKNLRDVSIAKKATRRDVVDKMSANHKISFSKERKNHLKLLRETRYLYEKRLSDVEKFYVAKITVLEENRTMAFDSLLESKCTLEEQIRKSSDSLNNIINIISSYPSNITTTAMQSIPIAQNQVKSFSTVKRSIPKESESDLKSFDKVDSLKTEIYEQKLRITCLENKIKDEITSKGQIQQKLSYTELLYRTTIREKDQIIKNLQDDLANLTCSKTEMETRHKEQFMKYDRMLKRAQAEIAVQKREVLALRTQFVPGTPTNFNPMKRKDTSSMIKESTPSNSKVLSNISAPLLSESMPSFSTAASNLSTPSRVIFLNQTQTSSSKTSKSLRSNNDSTNSTYAAFQSNDLEDPKPKSTRVLRSKRKRVNKARKAL